MIFYQADLNKAKIEKKQMLEELLELLELTNNFESSAINAKLDEIFGGNFAAFVNNCFFIAAELKGDYEKELRLNNKAAYEQLDYIFSNDIKKLYQITGEEGRVIKVFFEDAKNILSQLKKDANKQKILGLVYNILLKVKSGRDPYTVPQESNASKKDLTNKQADTPNGGNKRTLVFAGIAALIALTFLIIVIKEIKK